MVTVRAANISGIVWSETATAGAFVVGAIVVGAHHALLLVHTIVVGAAVVGARAIVDKAAAVGALVSVYRRYCGTIGVGLVISGA